MDEQVNPLERDHCLSVVLPGGLEKNATVHGSKPVMDLLVTLCASYHLNPSDYTVEVLSPNKNIISFKPNSAIGSLEAETIVLKPKGAEEKIRRPYMPEASVRLLINYNKSHKAVVRVSPGVPLQMLLPVVCSKCELDVDTTVLLRDSQSKELLDLTKTLNEHGLREVFAKDTARRESADHQHPPMTPEAAVTPPEVTSPPPLRDLPKREKKQKKTAGFLSLFRKGKKTTETERSAPASPGLHKQGGVAVNGQDVSSSTALPADMAKKRRAPLPPPMGVSQSVPGNLSYCHLREPQTSAESTLRRTKRRAPPPPCADGPQELQADAQETTLNTLEERRESDESVSVNLSFSSSSSPRPSHPWSVASSSRRSLHHLHEMAEPYLPSLRGKDLPDARWALAKVLTSSVSKGTLLKRLRNSVAFPKSHSGSFASASGSDNGAYSPELEPVLASNLPTEPEWEDPRRRKGMTTFKVVPAKEQTSQNPELSLDGAHQTRDEDQPDDGGSPEIQEPCSPDGSETAQSPEPSPEETPASPEPPLDSDRQDRPDSPPSEVGVTEQRGEAEPEAPSDCSEEELQSEFLQSPSRRSVSTDHRSSDTDEREVDEKVMEEEDKEEEDPFPPPPSPISFHEDIEVTEGEREDAAASPQPSTRPPSPSPDGQTSALSEPQEEPEQSATRPRDWMCAPSRFAQAVALAVQRSRLQSQGKGVGPQAQSGPHSSVPSPARSTYQFGA